MNWDILLTPAVAWIFIPIAFALVEGVIRVYKITTEHMERRLMIEQGMHPDFDRDDEEQPIEPANEYTAPAAR